MILEGCSEERIYAPSANVLRLAIQKQHENGLFQGMAMRVARAN
jgi:hypothetical protein